MRVIVGGIPEKYIENFDAAKKIMDEGGQDYLAWANTSAFFAAMHAMLSRAVAEQQKFDGLNEGYTSNDKDATVDTTGEVMAELAVMLMFATAYLDDVRAEILFDDSEPRDKLELSGYDHLYYMACRWHRMIDAAFVASVDTGALDDKPLGQKHPRIANKCMLGLIIDVVGWAEQRGYDLSKYVRDTVESGLNLTGLSR